MAGLPLSLAIPAAASAAAYIDAKLGISNDLKAISTFVGYERHQARLLKAARLNAFYMLEDLAKHRASATRPFLVLPPDTLRAGQQSQWTYAEAYDTTLKYAAWLKQEHGVRQGEVVAMDFTNKPDFLWLWFALWSLGAQPAFINSNLRDKAFVHCLRVSTARLLLLDPSIRDVLSDDTCRELGADEHRPAIDTAIIEDGIVRAISDLPPYRAPDSARAAAILSSTAILIYTSGTTGLPKAAKVSWAKVHGGLYAFSTTMGLVASDRYYSALPLYHSSASQLCVCACLGAGCTYVMGPKFSPRTFMQQVSQTDSTAIQYIGEMCRYLLSTPPSPYDKQHRLKVALGNGLRPDVWQPFRDRFNIPLIVEFYGATEGPGATAVQSRNAFTRGAIGHAGLVQRALSRSTSALLKFDHLADAPLRHPETNLCLRCDPDEPGELVSALDPASISDKFQGYLGNARASADKVLRDVFAPGDAWYRSGDLLRRDRDGRLWFVDRVGDTFRWKGENVSTAEVATALGAHPAVQEANVYGVQLPGHDGRAGCAAVILRPGFAFTPALGRDLAAHVRAGLPRYAVPLFLRLVKGEFEVTGTQKQQKVRLREEGVDPSKTGGDEVLWLPDLAGAEGYRAFGQREWEGLVGGKVKL